MPHPVQMQHQKASSHLHKKKIGTVLVYTLSEAHFLITKKYIYFCEEKKNQICWPSPAMRYQKIKSFPDRKFDIKAGGQDNLRY